MPEVDGVIAVLLVNTFSLRRPTMWTQAIGRTLHTALFDGT